MELSEVDDTQYCETHGSKIRSSRLHLDPHHAESNAIHDTH